ncbi:DUF1326 domain-containing protein [Pseudomonas sp. GCM10022188]|uniref:DUF1326 domain-containing protein n=1 Tax=Pseudomonas TaxID=286 RepID=UPI001E5D26C9|nr:DUF1326 domain-containing protein [Pseudomonas oryzagri]MCC6076315.1 DUF1326 domain-containing protein [Pseudomonas oryzagri]
MSAIDWYVEGVEFGSCSCIHACPCQFEGLPSRGDCRGFEVVRIDQGHFGAVDLGGLKAALLYAWPGAIFEGGGEMQVIVDVAADTAQREALVKILHGEETSEGATHWWVFHAMCDRVHEPLFLPIDCTVDIDARRAQVSIPGVLESVGRPIVSPATGDEHRVRIDIPNGIEFELAEIGSATTTATGAIRLDLADTYGQFNLLRHSRDGVVHGRQP